MIEREILDEILLPLADIFEARNRTVATFQGSSAEEYEPLRECLATLIAEGSVTDSRKMGGYRFTAAGYAKYKPRIDALRAVPQAKPS